MCWIFKFYAHGKIDFLVGINRGRVGGFSEIRDTSTSKAICSMGLAREVDD